MKTSFTTPPAKRSSGSPFPQMCCQRAVRMGLACGLLCGGVSCLIATRSLAAQPAPAEHAAEATTHTQTGEGILAAKDVGGGGTDPRLYASGGLASSAFNAGPAGGLPGPVNGFGFVGGGTPGAEGAIGMAFARPAGSLRLEFEARGRQAGEAPAPGAMPAGQATWATLANVWRDVSLSKRVGVYAGGGVGGGGAMAVADAASPSAQAAGMSGLAWQAGGGLTYDMNDRVTLDFGYRYRGIESVSGTGRVDGSEAILAVRIYEPFRDVWK